MPEMRSYNGMEIEILRSTEYPAELVGLARDITTKQDPEADILPITKKSAHYLWFAEHQSLFEHVTYTFLLQNVSRSFLAQITRQRTASPTSGSQHYQEYDEYPCCVSQEVIDDPIMFELNEVSFGHCYGNYHHAIHELGQKPEEARQMLPNAAAVNYLWTIDALNLAKFLRQRTCNRNVEEMRIFANRVLHLVQKHFPELFGIVGPQCFMDKLYGGCKQGFLQCDKKYWDMIG